MDSLQKQVTALSHKVDALHQIVDRLSERMSDALTECRLTPTQGTQNTQGEEVVGLYATRGYSSLKPTLEHKDVLADGACLDTHRQNGEKEISPEIQIQRLTAQLTAAYNRIAALEERLLAQRVHEEKGA